jgi:structural maintenance of chromosome 4
MSVQLEATESRYSTCLKEHNTITAELEKSNKEFKEFERKDIKYREDLKHAKTKVKKAEEKRTKAEAKLQAGAEQVRRVRNDSRGDGSSQPIEGLEV